MKDENKCHLGFTPKCCPKRKLENEKLFYGLLLIVAVGLLLVDALVFHR